MCAGKNRSFFKLKAKFRDNPVEVYAMKMILEGSCFIIL